MSILCGESIKESDYSFPVSYTHLVVPLPGHTMGSTGLLFDGPEGKVLVAGDSVMTREFFEHQKGYFKSESQAASTKTIQWISKHTDIVVPGHDNYFFVNAYKFN